MLMIRRNFLGVILSFIMVATIFAGISMNATAEGGGSDEDIVAYWSFDNDVGNTIIDDSGNDLNGTNYGAASTVGIADKALKFDGNDDYVGNIGTYSSFNYMQNTGVFTIEAWIKLDNNTEDDFFAIVANQAGSAYKGFFFIYDNNYGNCNNQLRLGLLKGSSGNTVINSKSSEDIITDNNWHHVAVTGNGINVTFYVDGVPDQGSGSMGSKSTGDSTNLLNIGRTPHPTAPAPFKGSIDEVAIYDNTLSSEVIKQHYEKYTQGPIAKWKFENDFNDSIDGHHGTGYNGVTFSDGKFGKAASFDGVNDYIEVPDDDNLDFGNESFSIEFWMKLPDIPLSGDANNEAWVMSKVYYDLGFQISITCQGYQNGLLRFQFYNYTYEYLYSDIIVDDGKWHYISCIRIGKEKIEMHIDGKLSASKNLTLNIESISNNYPLTIGSTHVHNRNYGGLLDEIIFWKRALSSDEIENRYNSMISKYLDLSIAQDDITFSNPTPSPDEEVTITATIENIGTISGSAKVKFWDRDPTKTTTWTKESGVRVNIGGIYDSMTAVSPETIKLDNGTYRMYYTGSDSSNSRILSAISTDGITWTKESGVRIDPETASDVVYPSVIELPNNTYRMYFVENPDGGNNVYIRSATSSDGLNWNKENGKRINYGGTYDSIGASTPEVLELANGSYRMYYCGVDASWKYRIISAWSSDGIFWVKESGIRINIGGVYDSVVAFFPSILVTIDGKYIMYYAGGNDYTTKKILSATSVDGLIWIKESGIRLDKGGLYDINSVATPEVIKLLDDKIKMYYSGKNGTTWSILSATTTLNATLIAEKGITNLTPGTNTSVNTLWKVPSVPGNYSVFVTIEDWSSQDSNLTNNIASKILKVTYLPPVANAGPNQTVNEGEVVEFNGSGSVGSPILPTIDSNVVAFWHMDEGSGNVAYDSSENEYDGELKGSASWTEGVAGSALKSNGWDNNCEAPHIPLNYRNFTVDLWFKLDPGFTYSHLFNQKESTTTHKALHYVVKSTDLKLRMGFYYNDLDSNTAVQTDKWYHVAFVYDYTLDWKYIYLNGVLDNDGASNGPFQGASGITRIGHCNGAIDKEGYTISSSIHIEYLLQ